MDRLRPKRRSEKSVELAIRSTLEAAGWLVGKTHGNAFQPGWPDLFCFHRDHGVRWIEVKRPAGRLTQAQRKTFPLWTSFGVGIWILTGTEGMWELLFASPNWEGLARR